MDGCHFPMSSSPSRVELVQGQWKYPVFLAGERGKLLALCIAGYSLVANFFPGQILV